MAELQPEDEVTINNAAWIMCEEQGKHQQALELAEKGLKLAPQYVDLIDTRGVIYYRLGKLDKAIADFITCIKLYPDTVAGCVGSHFHLARALAASGQRTRALEHLSQALDLESRIGGLSPQDMEEAKNLRKKISIQR